MNEQRAFSLKNPLKNVSKLCFFLRLYQFDYQEGFETVSGAKIGYARVSTKEQSLDLQLDALRQVGCIKIFEDHGSGSSFDRPGLKACMDYLRPGDALVVWKLDRLGRSLQELLKTVNDLNDKGVGFISLTEGFDTTTANGKLIFSIFGALAEFERAIIRERVNAGLDAARARGVKCGRKKKIQDDKLEYMKYLYRERGKTVKEICKELGISRATFYRALDPVRYGSSYVSARDSTCG